MAFVPGILDHPPSRTMTPALVSGLPARGPALGGVGGLPVALPVAGRADAVDRGGTGEFRRLPRIEHHQRPAAVLGVLDSLPQDAAVGADRLVGLAEMLL